MQNSNRLILSSGEVYLARAGGGGSSSGGGDSSSGGGGYYSGGSYAGSTSGAFADDGWSFLFSMLFFGVSFLVFILVLRKIGARGLKKSSVPFGYIDAGSQKQASDLEIRLTAQAKNIFIKFQKYWSEFDIAKMKDILEMEYCKKITLQLNVLKNYERQNIMDNVAIQQAFIKKADSYKSNFSIYFTASANDKLIDKRDDKILFEDKQTFSEIWNFKKLGKKYVLESIEQTTKESSKYNTEIHEFAKSNNFYYDPDFGWLMMPSRGAIFGPEGFGSADINNHVIGHFKDKIVEFYSYEARSGSGLQPITVAQAILPRRYDNILVTEKSWYSFRPKLKTLQKIETESISFNQKFSVWAAVPDRASSFELLATNFMEKIYALDFEINIEVVDNVLYIYSPSKDIKYQNLLDVLDGAFEEMKM